MTRSALTRIVVCFVLLSVFLLSCLTLDAVLVPREDRSEQKGVSATPAESLDERSLLETIESDDLTSAYLAERYLDTSFDETIPDDFIAETLDPQVFEEAFCSGAILGFIYDGSATQAAKICRDQLEDKGWIALERQEKNDANVESFVKATGAYRWLTLQYYPADGMTTIVVDAVDQR